MSALADLGIKTYEDYKRNVPFGKENNKWKYFR